MKTLLSITLLFISVGAWGQTTTAVRFLSVEPLLEAVDLTKFLECTDSDNLDQEALNTHGQTGNPCSQGADSEGPANAEAVAKVGIGSRQEAERVHSRIDLVICGGESGPGEGHFILKFYPKLDTTYELDYFSDEGTHGTYLPDLDGTGDHKTTPNVYRHFDKSDWLPYLSDQNGNPLPPEVKKPKREPVDVPAIQEKVEVGTVQQYGCLPDPNNPQHPHGPDGNWCYVPPAPKQLRWTCADKSRTLLETLDGKTRYCHKPQLTER